MVVEELFVQFLAEHMSFIPQLGCGSSPHKEDCWVCCFQLFFFFIFRMFSVQLKAVVLGVPYIALAEDG